MFYESFNKIIFELGNTNPELVPVPVDIGDVAVLAIIFTNKCIRQTGTSYQLVVTGNHRSRHISPNVQEKKFFRLDASR